MTFDLIKFNRFIDLSTFISVHFIRCLLEIVFSGGMTARERSEFYSDFMSRVMDAPTAKYPNSPGSTPYTG